LAGEPGGADSAGGLGEEASRLNLFRKTRDVVRELGVVAQALHN
jgi:hypothetical protein